VTQYSKQVEFMKVDDELGLVFGFAIVCSEGGVPFIDLQKDHCPEDAMVEAGLELMENPISVDDHAREDDGVTPVVDGRIPFVFPLTTDIAKSMGIKTERTGLMIGMKPSEEVLAKFKSGEYKGFSIGGAYRENETRDLP